MDDYVFDNFLRNAVETDTDDSDHHPLVAIKVIGTLFGGCDTHISPVQKCDKCQFVANSHSCRRIHRDELIPESFCLHQTILDFCDSMLAIASSSHDRMVCVRVLHAIDTLNNPDSI